MTEIYHYLGNDLLLNDVGDLLLVSGTQEGQQRVLRRLLTPVKGYIERLSYGAGVPQYVGQTYDENEVTAEIIEQMYMESAVSQSPTPTVKFTPLSSGQFTVTIEYTDAVTQLPIVFTFNPSTLA